MLETVGSPPCPAGSCARPRTRRLNRSITAHTAMARLRNQAGDGFERGRA